MPIVKITTIIMQILFVDRDSNLNGRKMNCAGADAWREDSRTLSTPINAARSHGRLPLWYHSRALRAHHTFARQPAYTPRWEWNANTRVTPVLLHRLASTRFENRETQTFARLSRSLSMVCRWSVSAPRARLASHYLYRKERTAFRHDMYVCTFILLPF
jgi:hypothetical protein